MTELLPAKIEGIRYVDDRGVLKAWHFPEKFEVKRVYTVCNWKQGFIRAWHGHLHEAKLIVVVQGAGMIACVPLDDPVSPNQNEVPLRFSLDAASTSGVFIPAGFANGLMSLTEDCEFLVFSNRTVEQSKGDDYRYDFDYWQAWEIEQR
jgi:dTDP-4-dehydrorhamnose 3,5-epimerase